MSTTSSSSPPKMAILDDYHSLAAPHFSHIPASTLSVTRLDPLPPLTPSTLPQYTKALHPYTIFSTMRERTALPRALLASLPNLRLVLGTGSQFETFDRAAMAELGIALVAAPAQGRVDGTGKWRGRGLVGSAKNGGGHPTTQHAWALILALARNVAGDDAVVKGKTRAGGVAQGGWQTTLATGLQGLTLGVVGLGRLGAAVARVGVLAFGMRVVCWSENLSQDKADGMAVEMGLPVVGGGLAEEGEKTFRFVGKEEVFQRADVVTLHYVLSERSRGLVGEKELAAMKPNAYFVNTSRGPLVEEKALFETLMEGRIKGAALDVFDIEPLPVDSPWRTEDWDEPGKSRVLLTPHMGYVEEGTINTWYEESAENLERWLDGRELLHRLV
ncbi:glycerate dehydrogenase [Mytilinidion resinicola]|uniref:Glycerate dehydrogenase n=1 Tax=Mytilinidion resinicola TaxID=574789 RepID=A0A6A6Z3I0_9PEZI|nr:glycerate dehydrogenase [Mytilinidion resinicola]KAF2814715.1 glycerate dehydrogenase [Mytilinidion resinicola]